MNEAQLDERLREVWRMPPGRGQIAATEEVIRHADALAVPHLQYVTRMLGTRAYTQGGEPAKAFVTFSWCLAAYDRGESVPDFDHNLFWHFKWVVDALTDFPEIPLARTYAALDDMERRYRLAGHTMNPVHQYRASVAMHLGDVASAQEQYRLWCAAPRGEMSDCIGCEPTSKVRHLSWLGRDEDAIAVALPVLGGQVDCTEQPHAILTELLLPYVRTGHLEEAAAAHRQAYRAIQSDRAELAMIADHVAFCALTGNHARGLELVERHLPWLEEPSSPFADLYFTASAALLLSRVPADTVLRNEVSAGAAREELTGRALGLAERFDARNGTPEQGRVIRALLAAEPLVEHLPLSGPARQSRRPSPPVRQYPSSPEDLADLAVREFRLGNNAAAAAVWARFDEVCPDPPPVLLARRLDAEAAELTQTDLDAAERLWLRAIDLFAEARDEGCRQVALGRLGLLHCAAGDHAEGLAEIEASVAALVGLGDEVAAARALTRQAIGHRIADDLPAGLRALERAAALASGDAVLVASIAVDRADFTAAQGAEHFADAASLATQAVSLYQKVGPCGGRYRAHYLAGRLLAATGDLERAYDEFEAAARSDDQGLRGDALHYRGRIALDLDRPAEAYRALSDSVADLLAAGSPAAYARVNLAAAALAADRPADAADAAEDAAPELDQLGDAEEAARARYLLARAYRALGSPDLALELLDTVTEHCVAQGNPAGAGQMCMLSGEILDDLDRDALAAQAFTRAADFYQDASLAEPELRTRRRAALSWRWAGATDESLTALAAAEEVASEVPPDFAWELALLSYDAARILAAAGKLADAVDRLDGTAERFRLMDAPVEAAMTDALHGRLLADLGRPTDAEKLLTDALAALPADLTRPREELEALLADIRC